MTTKQESAIRKHGDNLKGIFPKVAGMDSVKLCKALRRIEAIARRGATAWCNGEQVTEYGKTYAFHADENAWENFADMILAKLEKLLGYKTAGVPVFVNGDARGYALKIDSDYLTEYRKGWRFGGPTPQEKLHSDMGGFGILAPEIGANGEG